MKSAILSRFITTLILFWFVLSSGCAALTNRAENTLQTRAASPLAVSTNLPPFGSPTTDMIPTSAGFTPAEAVASPDDLTVYSEALASGWGNWSWGVGSNLNNPAPVRGGTKSIAATFSQGWDGLKFGRSDGLDVSAYDTLSFWIHGGAGGGQTVEIQVSDGCAQATQTVHPSANTWTRVEVSLRPLARPYKVFSLVWWNPGEDMQPTFYIDDIAFVASGVPEPAPVTRAGPALRVDASADRHPISPFIYGMNFSDEDLAAELHLPVRRWGGNSTTRYNWQNDTTNTGSDWYFENVPQENTHPELLPDGSTTDRFIEQDRRTGSQTLLTIPMIGWTAKRRNTGHPFDCGFKVSQYGAQQKVDSDWDPDCGNGVKSNGSPITNNDPLDTSTSISAAFVQNWISHLTGKYGTATNGGVRFYNLDNEPMLWNSTHRDVHPGSTSYDELYTRTVQYAAAIKATDPEAKTLGPVLWGWTAYFYSALDITSGGYNWWDSRPDRKNHGDIPFVPWYLGQMRTYQQAHGTRLLDYLDLHYYPQAEGIFSNNPGDSNVQAVRLRSTRSLWDPTYTDESWIADTEDGPAVRLIPRMRAWADDNYSGTKLAISEYSWGAMCHINGALAQADVLGIFGRERLDLATLWGPPSADQPGAFAFRMYRNVDGQGNGFGETGVRAASSDPAQLAIFAAQRTQDNALTLLIINKNLDTLTSTVTINGFSAQGAAQAYRYSAEDTSAIQRLPDQSLVAGKLTAAIPGSSLTLFVLSSTDSLLPSLFMPLIRR
jgi:hypothetical protein